MYTAPSIVAFVGVLILIATVGAWPPFIRQIMKLIDPPEQFPNELYQKSE